MARILVVEDEANNIEILQRLLSRNGHDVVVAGSRDAAIAVMTDDPAELVLMDIGMPGLNGLEVTAQVTRKFPDVRIIILSMHATEEYALSALRAGAVGYLLKDAGAALTVTHRGHVESAEHLTKDSSQVLNVDEIPDD